MLPPTPTNYILFVLDFDVKFPLLRLLLFLSDLKSTVQEGKSQYLTSELKFTSMNFICQYFNYD